MRRSIPSILAIALFATLSAAPVAAQDATILVGLHAGVPTIASIGIGTGKSIGKGRLLFTMFEPGIAGGRASVGVAGGGSRVTPSLRATWLRTWGKPVGAITSQNYLGPELQLTGNSNGQGLRGGLLFPVGRGGRTAGSLGLSFGF